MEYNIFLIKEKLKVINEELEKRTLSQEEKFEIVDLINEISKELKLLKFFEENLIKEIKEKINEQ